MKNNNSNQRAWLGLFLIILGGYFLLNNLDLIPDWIPSYLLGWEMGIVLLGTTMIFTGRKEGLIFLTIGGFLLADDIFYIPELHFRDWWPLILVVIGITIILRRRDHAHQNLSSADQDFMEETSIFGGSQKSYTSQNFKGGKLTAVFGGSEINFSHAQLAYQEVVLDIFCMFGGHSITVPEDWTIINESFVIFGGYSDERPQGYRDPNKVLRIKGSVIFGGAEIKS